MDAKKFDQLSKSIAARSTRRSALRRLGLGGLLGGAASAGLTSRAFAASDGTCVLQLSAKTAIGSDKSKSYQGELTLTIGQDGAIDDGSFDDGSGDEPTVSGQATGRALSFRLDYSNGDHLAFEGVAAQDLSLCRGQIDGVFNGPAQSDMGTWTATAGTSAQSGNATGTISTVAAGNGGSGGGSSSCPSGVVCGGTCCTPRQGYTPDSIACDGDSCSCSYSCVATGCPTGDANTFITVGCEDRPDALCGEVCNVAPGDNGSGTSNSGSSNSGSGNSGTGNSGSGNGGGTGNGGGSVANCPPSITLCDGTTPCCEAFAPYEATDISCVGGACKCMYSCAQAGCSSNSTSTFMTVTCSQNPNDLCASMGCS
jgi:hypothetical protein